MVTLLSIGVASYNGFNQTATLEGAHKGLRANLRLAQSFALNGEKIGATCTGVFNGYYVTLANGGTSYQIGQYCSTSGSTDRTPPSPVNLPTGVTIQNLSLSPITVLFQSVKGAIFYNCGTPPCYTVPVAGPLTFQVRLNGVNRSLTITSEGKIQ